MVIGSSFIEFHRILKTVVVLTAIFLVLTIGSLQSEAQPQAPVPSQEQTKGSVHLKLMEDSVTILASRLSDVYPSKCDDRKTCDICSQDECRPLNGNLVCANVSHNVRCNIHFPTCTASIRVTMERSSVAYPRESLHSEPDSAQARTICGTTDLDATFQDLFKKNPYHAEYYVGFPDGSRRSFPGGEEADSQSPRLCTDYDCRKRPWFNAAISHKNHLVILVDSRQEPLDASFTEQSYTLTFAQKCANMLLGTVYDNDRVNIVPFSSAAQAQALEKKSVRVEFNTSDPQNHKELQPLLQKLAALRPAQDDSNVASSNLTAGLQEALRLFDTATDMATKNIIVFTNGDISYDTLTLNQVTDKRIRLFIFSMKNTDDKLQALDALAKTAGGAHIRLTTSVNLIYQMRAYFSYMARLQAQSKRTMPFWTPSYKDYYEIGHIITVVAPAFSKSEPHKLIGVAAVDVLYLEIGDILTDFQDALRNRPYNEGSIDAAVFHSVEVYDDNSTDSCDFNGVGNVMCKDKVIVDKKQDFLDRMCCDMCSGKKGDRGTQRIAIVTSIFGILGLCLFGATAFRCWQRIRPASRVVEDSGASVQDNGESGTPTDRSSSDSLLVRPPRTKEESAKAAGTPRSIHQASIRLCVESVKYEIPTARLV